MPTSQNGYRANDRSLIKSYNVPGGRIAMRKGDVATVLCYVAERFHSEVEPLVWPGNWGYAERKIRGGSALSNHASGTAIDLNAPQHPLGTAPTVNFTAGQIAAVRKIVKDCDGVIRWGGDYSGRKDGMHFEINRGTDAVRALAEAIRAGSKPGPKGGATEEAPKPKPKWREVTGKTPTVEKGDKGEPVERVQKAIGVKVDGLFGGDTEGGVKAFQRKHGLDDDGIVGPDTWAKINAPKTTVKPKPKPKPATPRVPKFPLPAEHYYGVEDDDKENHSGYYERDRAGIRKLQARLKARGWTIKVDGFFGEGTEKIVKAFQREKGLVVDGLVGISTWGALWKSPVT